MFSKILIANRGEIACRVIRTARRLGIATVAVYSEADAGALHVAMADEAWLIGPAAPRLSYLDIAAVLRAAQQSGAEAVHPGYGFLSENAEFAEACAAANLVFIGPPAAAIRAMGSKAAAKTLMSERGVPVVPGYHGADQDPDRLLAAAARIGFPVMLKASAGGGGRGMRIVRELAEFAAALDGAIREAEGAFGDGRMLIERYLEAPRHIEVQVFGDTHGNIVQLGERDCSIQRRHQKIIEEAPAPGLPPETRAALGDTAVRAAQAVGYVGAGTVEFIVENGAFYFMEMNTRLQVEHPVTEAVTGLDLVEWQLVVAAGERLPLRQEEIHFGGHAIEARLYAENPERGFLPSTGTLHALYLPAGAGVRVDTGLGAGDRMTPYYDPLIAKIIACGADRAAARARLARALADSAVVGVATNLDLLGRIVADADFAAGGADTGFIERRPLLLLRPAALPPDWVLAAVALHRLLALQAAEREADPWSGSGGWRLNLAPAAITVALRCEGVDYRLAASAQAGGWRLLIDERCTLVAGEKLPDARLAVTCDGVRRVLRVIAHGAAFFVAAGEGRWQLAEIDPLRPPEAAGVAGGRLTSPMPGRVVQQLVRPGDRVQQGQAVMVVEAMKMEHTIAAPRDGVVAAVHYREGDLVDEGAELLALAAADDDRSA